MGKDAERKLVTVDSMPWETFLKGEVAAAAWSEDTGSLLKCFYHKHNIKQKHKVFASLCYVYVYDCSCH